MMQNVMSPTFNMVPIPPEMQELLKPYGVERHMTAYFDRNEPNRIYVNAYGQLYFIDLSMINPDNNNVVPCELEMLPVVEIGDDMANGVQNHNKNDKNLVNKSSNYTNISEWKMLTDSEREELQRERRRKNAFKTSLCRSFRENNSCVYGKECAFAHGENELRLPPQAHPKYKTQLCNKFSVSNYCPYGARCQYIHQRVNKISKISTNTMHMKNNSERSNAKNFPSVTLKASPKCFNVKNASKIKEMEKSQVKYANSPVALGNNSSFAEHGGFCSSLANTNFNNEKKQGKQPVKVSSLLNPHHSGYGNNEHQLKTTDNGILNEIRENFNNMNIDDNNNNNNSDNIFSRSCFPRIGLNETK